MTKADLHRLVDNLPDVRTDAATRILECLTSEGRSELAEALLEEPHDPFLQALAAAPEDDELETEEERDMVREALEESAQGESIPWEDVKRSLFPDGL